MHYYPPYWGTGIHVETPDNNMHHFVVTMKLTPLNRNYVGVHFGGSLYSMCDPFYMLIAMEKLGSDYIVWDKSATIHFKKPGRGTVSARFSIEDQKISEIKKEVADLGKCTPAFTVDVVSEQGEVVAQVEKTLWVSLKKK